MPSTRRVRRLRKTATKRRRHVSKTRRNRHRTRPRNRRGTRVARGRYDIEECPVCLTPTDELIHNGVRIGEMLLCEHQICEECFEKIQGQKKCPLCKGVVTRLVDRTNQQQLWPNEVEPVNNSHNVQPNQEEDIRILIEDYENAYARREITYNVLQNMLRRRFADNAVINAYYNRFIRALEQINAFAHNHIIFIYETIRANMENEADDDLPYYGILIPNFIVWYEVNRRENEPILTEEMGHLPQNLNIHIIIKLLAYILIAEVPRSNYNRMMHEVFRLQPLY